MIVSALKHVRDAIADVAAACAAHSTLGERIFIALAHRLVRWPALYGLARRAMHTLSSRLRARGDGIRCVTVGPVSFQIDVTSDVIREAYFAGLPCEPATTAWLLDHLSPGDTVVDVGANVGYVSLLAASRVGTNGRVVAFEPNPAVRARLVAHVAANGQQGVIHVSALALGDLTGPATLHVPPAAAESGIASLHLTPALAQRRPTATAVQTTRFDDWLAATPLGAVFLMKIDVEGAEAEVLRGAVHWLATSPPAHIICETIWEGPAHRMLVAGGYAATPLDWFDRAHGAANILFSRD